MCLAPLASLCGGRPSHHTPVCGSSHSIYTQRGLQLLPSSVPFITRTKPGLHLLSQSLCPWIVFTPRHGVSKSPRSYLPLYTPLPPMHTPSCGVTPLHQSPSFTTLHEPSHLMLPPPLSPVPPIHVIVGGLSLSFSIAPFLLPLLFSPVASQQPPSLLCPSQPPPPASPLLLVCDCSVWVGGEGVREGGQANVLQLLHHLYTQHTRAALHQRLQP